MLPKKPVPQDIYDGNHKHITLADGCDSLNVESGKLFFKASNGDIIYRRASHNRKSSESEFTLENGLTDGVYHLLYMEYEALDEDGSVENQEYGIGCRLLFKGGEVTSLSHYNDTFEMYSSGTEVDTLYVTSVDHIINIVNMCNDVRYNDEFTDDTYFLQLRDIDGDELAEEASRKYGWLPIGWQPSLPFRGTYDGGGHTIEGLWIDREYMAPVGFIGVSEGARVCNLHLANADLKGDMAVAGIVGVATSSEGKRQLTYIDNCSISNSSIAGAKDSYAVGGILGIVDCQSRAHIQQCRSISNTISAHSQAGGLVGAGARTSSLIAQSCENTSDVTSEYNSCGGIVGACDTLLAGSCINRGAVTGAYKFTSPNAELGLGNTGCGGIAGGTGVSYLVGCYNEGVVTGRSGVGGVVGSARFTGGDPNDEGYSYNNVAMRMCANKASVYGDEFVGGLCGDAQFAVYGGYNEGHVRAEGNYAGGIFGGGAMAVVHNAVNKGYIYADAYAGGIIGMSAVGSIVVNQNYGVVEAKTSHGAGIIGYLGGRGTMTYCANYGDIVCTGSYATTREDSSGEHYGGVSGQVGDHNEYTPIEIMSIVYASVSAAVGIAGAMFAVVEYAGMGGKLLTKLSNLATFYGANTIWIDTLFFAAGISEKMDAEEARKIAEESYKENEESSNKVNNFITKARNAYVATIPTNFSATVANAEYQQRVENLISFLNSEENMRTYNDNLNESEYDKMVRQHEEARAKDIRHSSLSGFFIVVGAVGTALTIAASAGAAVPVLAGAALGAFAAVGGSANSIWETCTTYEDNVDEVSHCCNFAHIHVPSGSTKVGGVVGVAEENVVVMDCLNAGVGTAGGHIVGEIYHKGELRRCISIADGNAWGGEVVSDADNNASIADLYYYSASGSQTMSDAVGLTREQIGDKSNYKNWDIGDGNSLWTIPAGEGSFPIPNVSRFTYTK